MTSLDEHHIDLDSFSINLKEKKINTDNIQISSEPMARKKYNTN